METWVYQLHSDTELLYVGKSYSLHKRLAKHRQDKPWWPEVTEIRKEQFATEDEARQREKELWATERPKYNRYSPLRTREEALQIDRERQQRRRQDPGVKENNRKYDRKYQRERARTDVEYRERMRKSSREWKRKYRVGTGKRWQQEGPGLF